MISIDNMRISFSQKQPGMGMNGYVVNGPGYRLDIPPHKYGQAMNLMVWAQGGSFVSANVPTAALAPPLSTFMSEGWAILNVDFGKQPQLTGVEQMLRMRIILRNFDYLPDSVSRWDRIAGLGLSAGGHHLLFNHITSLKFDKLCLWGVPVDWEKYVSTLTGAYWVSGETLADQTTSQLKAGSPINFMQGEFPEILPVYWMTVGQSGDPAEDAHDGIGGQDLESKGSAETIFYDPGEANVNLYTAFPVSQVIDHFLS